MNLVTPTDDDDDDDTVGVLKGKNCNSEVIHESNTIVMLNTPEKLSEKVNSKSQKFHASYS